MPKLEVKTFKKLKLKNIIIKELRGIKAEDTDGEIQKFLNKLQLLKIKGFGPFIVKNCGTQIHDDGTLTNDYDLIVQAHDYKQYSNQFKIAETLSCDYCAYIHYEGSEKEFSWATLKMDLFFYENDLESNGITYTLFINEASDNMVVDLFRPVSNYEAI